MAVLVLLDEAINILRKVAVIYQVFGWLQNTKEVRGSMILLSEANNIVHEVAVICKALK